MRPNLSSLQKQQGSMLVIAIFIITVMLLLGMSMLRVINNADKSLTSEILGIRAFYSAQSGVDIGLARLFPINDGKNTITSCEQVTKPIDLPDEIGFKTCHVTLGCQATNITYKQQVITQYSLISNAICGSGEHRVNRVVQVEARNNS